jgi:hypothetical protein
LTFAPQARPKYLTGDWPFSPVFLLESTKRLRAWSAYPAAPIVVGDTSYTNPFIFDPQQPAVFKLLYVRGVDDGQEWAAVRVAGDALHEDLLVEYSSAIVTTVHKAAGADTTQYKLQDTAELPAPAPAPAPAPVPAPAPAPAPVPAPTAASPSS